MFEYLTTIRFHYAIIASYQKLKMRVASYCFNLTTQRHNLTALQALFLFEYLLGKICHGF